MASEDGDYESVYRKVVESMNYSNEQKNTIIEAYERAYLKLDRSICRTCLPPYQPLNLYRLTSGLLDYFAGDRREKKRGHIFTLNQDLFLERGYQTNDHILRQPGIDGYYNFKWIAMDDPRSQDHIRTVPTEKEVEKHEEEDEQKLSSSGELQYIKIHGSMNWRNADGSNVMVIAGRKKEYISAEPLLNWYFQKFEKVFREDDIHLLVIGYGFGDPHVNKVLAKAISEHNLKCSVVYPPGWDQLRRRIRERGHQLKESGEPDHSETILEGICRGQILDFDLRQAFPPPGDAPETEHAIRLREAFGPS